MCRKANGRWLDFDESWEDGCIPDWCPLEDAKEDKSIRCNNSGCKCPDCYRNAEQEVE